MSRRRQAVERTKQEKLKRRQQRVQKFRETVSRTKLSYKMSERLDEAYHLIQDGEFAEAEALLRRLDNRGTSYPQIVEALMFLYQSTQDHERCCEAAKRLTIVTPRDPEAHLMYAQESMYCGRITIAHRGYEQFIERWPEHAHVTKAKTALEFLVPETQERLKNLDLPKERGIELLLLHEESLASLHQGNYSGCVAKCRELLAAHPTFASARNNLAIAYFQSGHESNAVSVLEETLDLLPDNRFAEATLAKLYFLVGQPSDSQRLADRIVADPPTSQDALVAAIETLALLGRDEDVVTVGEGATSDQLLDVDAQAARYHFLAYAKCRLGDEDAAKTLWGKCRKLYPQLVDARENLFDLEAGEGHAPWPCAFGKWIARETMDRVVHDMTSEKAIQLTRFPRLAAIVPPLLDRGDPLGREVGLRLAKADGSPAMLDALRDFALGSRGPDAMRFDALMFLQQNNAIDAGPHRVFSQGKWTDVQLLTAEIYDEPDDASASEHVIEKIGDGIEAMNRYDYDAAEACFQAALDEEPENCTATYNLCAVWLRRGDSALTRKATTRLEQLHQEFPEYPFATIALAQFAAMDHEFQKARDLLAPLFRASRLHISEAKSLHTAQVQLALEERDIASAERAYEVLRRLSEEGDANLLVLRKRIDKASQRRGRGGLLSPF
ncbi:MAG: tetratricopeptide repeat protein [Planctomycetaceae bacterium]|nr:tetratricopeptide repeat protein [Planctomycetales bacterium]MCB9921897.1 tetratricopeptide repeat protein [Planctomycetaceae bacterium]